MKCDMAIQTEVSLQNIRYVADLGLIWKKCAVKTVIRKSDMGHIWAKKSDLGNFSLQCELSLSVYGIVGSGSVCLWERRMKTDAISP